MSKLLRIRQIDAIILDEEIFKILKMIIDNGTKYLSVSFLWLLIFPHFQTLLFSI